MAYRARKAPRRTTRASARRAPARRSYARPARRVRRAAPRGRASSAGRTIRIVVVNESANPIARPPLGQMVAAAPKRARF